MSGYRFTIRGVRGSTIAVGKEFRRYGGHTTCFSLHTPKGLIIVDAGTGISRVDHEISACSALPPIAILFTHFHIDHIVGLPFFGALYRRTARVRLLADPHRDIPWRETLLAFFGRPYWPVALREAGARIAMEDLPAHADALDIFGARVSWCPVWHPQRCLAYRIEIPPAVIVIATDREPGNEALDARFLEFCRGADFLICDAQYTPEEYADHRGWGHGTWREAAALARRAGIGQLVLTHHDPGHTDRDQDRILARARKAFPRVQCAADDMVLVS